MLSSPRSSSAAIACRLSTLSSQLTFLTIRCSSLISMCGWRCEHLVDVDRVVLGAQAQQHAAALEREQLELHAVVDVARVVVGVELDPVEQRLADDAAPQRVVAIEREDLVEVAAGTARGQQDPARQLVPVARLVGRLGAVVEARVERLLAPDRLDDLGGGEQRGVGELGHDLLERGVEVRQRGVDRRAAPVRAGGAEAVQAADQHQLDAARLVERQPRLGGEPLAQCGDELRLEVGHARLEGRHQLVEEVDQHDQVQPRLGEAPDVVQVRVEVPLLDHRAPAGQQRVPAQVGAEQVGGDVGRDAGAQQRRIARLLQRRDRLHHVRHRALRVAQDREVAHAITCPPLTRRTSPVTNAASSEAR